MRINPSEQQAMSLIAEGYTAPQTALILYKSVDTIKTQLRDVRIRYAARNTTHAAILSERSGLLLPINNFDLSHFAKPVPISRSVKSLDDEVRRVIVAQFPSVDWDTIDWYNAFVRDEDLYFRILKGIGKAGLR